MRRVNRIIAAGLILVLLLSVNTPFSVSASGVKLNKTKLTLTVGTSATLKLTGTGNKKIVWRSSDTKTVTVTAKTKNGKKAKVKAKKAGKATVSAKVGKKTCKCRITVNKKNTDPEPTEEPEATEEPGTSTPPDVTPEVLPENYKKITPLEAKKIMDSSTDCVIVDVREADEYAEGHIPHAIQISNGIIKDEMLPELPDLNQLILVYCRSGRRSKEASIKLLNIGYTNVYDFGGIIDWPYTIVK